MAILRRGRRRHLRSSAGLAAAIAVCILFLYQRDAHGEAARFVDVGSAFSCALTAIGGVQCWGDNQSGLLGSGIAQQSINVPVDVIGLDSGVQAISTGGFHTCAVTQFSGAQCWGSNGAGQLGDGTTTRRGTPVTVAGLAVGVADISAGWGHSCAVTAAGNARCWGDNDYGQLGDGTTIDRTVPVEVDGLPPGGVAAIAAGARHTCALLTSSIIMCWGDNSFGQLGNRSTNPSIAPRFVNGVQGPISLSAGMWHNCAVQANGQARCWGRRDGGRLGDGTMEGIATSGVAVDLPNEDFATIYAGGVGSCATTTSGHAYCWGLNYNGQLGDGTLTDSALPVPVSGLGSDVTGVAISSNHACGVSADGVLHCWGSNSRGELGTERAHLSAEPVPAIGLADGVQSLGAGNYHLCAILDDDGLLCWGDNPDGQLGDGTTSESRVPIPIDGSGFGVSSVAGGVRHSCIVTTAGAVFCWGDNLHGQLGDGTNLDSLSPVSPIGLGAGITAITANWSHSCALTDAGAVFCWGDNDSGQLGDGTTIDRNFPTAVSGLTSGITAIAAGTNHTCALTSEGSVLCWGNNMDGQLGDGTFFDRSVPGPVIGLPSDIVGITAGEEFACALAEAGSVYCWGTNYYGELGRGTNSPSRSADPAVVGGLASNVSSIDSGRSFTCATDSNGAVHCWGRNLFYNLGQEGWNYRSTPVEVLGLGAVQSVIASDHTACVLDVSGGVLCWGLGYQGQLANGNGDHYDTPIPVFGFDGEPTPLPLLGTGSRVVLVCLLASMSYLGVRRTRRR